MMFVRLFFEGRHIDEGLLSLRALHSLHQHTHMNTPEYVSSSEGGVSTQQPPAFWRPTLTLNDDERVCHRLN